ncbi:hypothetical protein GHT06_013156 [Daphnia sinensis]|uniref:Uncharacterized protein n=1 Tax=Daphnia sinensis TaxID=1820382 RepID=A0AAD5KX31_9CRUS|nr:hypothetical protein GHT06_013156 [Daphnia sinensis]
MEGGKKNKKKKKCVGLSKKDFFFTLAADYLRKIDNAELRVRWYVRLVFVDSLSAEEERRECWELVRFESSSSRSLGGFNFSDIPPHLSCVPRT